MDRACEARAILLINCLLMAKAKIFQTFTDNLSTIFRKPTKTFLKNNRSRVLLKVFVRVLYCSKVFGEFWNSIGQHAFSVLFSS